MKRTAVPYIGLAALAGVTVLAFGLTQVFWLSIVFGVLAAAGAGLLAYALLPSPTPDLDALNEDVAERLRRARTLLDDIRERAKKIDPAKQTQPDGNIGDTLVSACTVVDDLFKVVGDKAHGELAATAARMNVYLVSVVATLEAYLSMQRNPNYFANAAQHMRDAEAGFNNFHNIALHAIQAANAGEVSQLRVELGMLRPMQAPQINE